MKCLAILFPNFEAVFLKGSLAAVLKTVYLIDEPALVVSSKHCDESGVAKFVSEQKGYDLHVILISVDIISLKKVFLMGWWSYLVEKSNKVLQLPVNIT